MGHDLVDQSTISFISLAASFLALAVSSLLAWRALEVSRDANNLAVVVDVLRQHRSPEFIAHEELLWATLATHDPGQGFAGLPSPIKEYTREVSLFYQTIAYLVEHNIAERRILVLETHYRLNRTWKAIAPFVEGERLLRGDPLSFLNTLEIFVDKARTFDVEGITRRMEAGNDHGWTPGRRSRTAGLRRQKS